jgi:hypothetical protein
VADFKTTQSPREAAIAIPDETAQSLPSKEIDQDIQPASDPEPEEPVYLKYMNASWHERTAKVLQQFEEVLGQLEDQRRRFDRDVFYEEMEKLNYQGVDKYECAPTTRLVNHVNNALEHRFRFKEELVQPTSKGQQYSTFEKGYIVEPVGKGLNYNLIATKPLKFYDQVLNQDVIKKKVYHDVDAELEMSQASVAYSARGSARGKRQDLGQSVSGSYLAVRQKDVSSRNPLGANHHH